MEMERWNAESANLKRWPRQSAADVCFRRTYSLQYLNTLALCHVPNIKQCCQVLNMSCLLLFQVRHEYLQTTFVSLAMTTATEFVIC
jgi:hypothetical protein